MKDHSQSFKKPPFGGILSMLMTIKRQTTTLNGNEKEVANFLQKPF